nr:hypothetical protein [uncultured Flavobacterium sp.]
MKNQTKKWLIIFSLLSILVIAFFQLNKTIKLIDYNSIKVESKNGLQIEKVEIHQGYFSINRKNDSELFKYKNPKIVFNRKETNLIKTEYGENDFLVIYDNKYYFQFRNFVYNDNDSVNYSFTLSKKENIVFIKVQIGDNNRIFKRKMNLISEADKYVCNTLKNKAHGSYNGIEFR